MMPLDHSLNAVGKRHPGSISKQSIRLADIRISDRHVTGLFGEPVNIRFFAKLIFNDPNHRQ